MKKKYLIFFISLIIMSNNVTAEEKIYPDVTKDIEIRYKWYKEIISGEGEYYPLRKITDTDVYDKNNFKYVRLSRINEEFCSYPGEFYQIEKQTHRIYRKLYDTSYIVIENIEPQTIVQIYYKSQPINYQIVSHENNILILKFTLKLLCDQLLFYVDTTNKYKISLYENSNLQFLLATKEFENQKISVPDDSWTIPQNAYYNTSISTLKYEQTSLTKLKEQTIMCGLHEKYVYKYNATREYYDNEYHAYVEGYIKDEEDYRYYYKGKPIVVNNIIEVTKEKIKEVPKLEYVYIEKEVNNDTKKQECPIITDTKIETKIIEKKVNTIPKKIYFIITLLSIIILVLIIKEIVKKCKLN